MKTSDLEIRDRAAIVLVMPQAVMLLTGLIPSGDALVLLGLVLATLAALWVILSLGTFVRLLFSKGAFMLRPLLHQFEQTVNNTEKHLLELREAEVQKRPGPEKWSRKEILGHLVDSACNNHQRFVRAQLSSEIRFSDYDQTAWVSVQKYQSEPWPALVRFWSDYNRHLIHIVSSISTKQLNGLCFIGEEEPLTLEFLIRDYIQHVNHHVRQILGAERIEAAEPTAEIPQ